MVAAEATVPACLRVAVCCGEGDLERWQLRCLALLAAVPGVELAARIGTAEHAPQRAADEPGSLRLWRRLCERSVLRRTVPADAITGSLPQLAGVPRVSVEEAASGRLQLDVILWLAAADPLAPLCGAARFGLWEIAHGDWTRRRGGPAGFWDYLRGAPWLSSALLLRTRAEEAIALRQATQQSRRFAFPRMVDEMLQRSAAWPAQVCRDLLEGHALHASAACPAARVAERAEPGAAELAGFAVQYAAALVHEIARQLFRHEQWNIALVDAPIASFLAADRARAPAWFDPALQDGFVADPFGLQQGDRLTVLCEKLMFADGIGTIASAQAGAAACARLPLAHASAVQIGPPVHLSYPYLIEHEGEIWCVPETHQAREVALYRAEVFPSRWVRVCTLLEDIAAADSTIFRHGDHWWLLCVDEDRGSPTDLFVWHAPALRGPWTPHRSNPVKSDVRSSRPAGTPFEHAGSLYRPAQDCSRTYGGRVAINRITCLTPERFAEETVAWVEPDPRGPYPDGLHTLSAVGDRTLLDGKRTVFAAGESWRVLARLAGALAGRSMRRRGLRADPAEP
jgi:hypothetical protein